MNYCLVFFSFICSLSSHFLCVATFWPALVRHIKRFTLSWIRMGRCVCVIFFSFSFFHLKINTSFWNPLYPSLKPMDEKLLCVYLELEWLGLSWFMGSSLPTECILDPIGSDEKEVRFLGSGSKWPRRQCTQPSTGELVGSSFQLAGNLVKKMLLAAAQRPATSYTKSSENITKGYH